VHASYNFWASAILIPAFSSKAELANLSTVMDRQLIVVWMVIMILAGFGLVIATQGQLGEKRDAAVRSRLPSSAFSIDLPINGKDR
jgi:hypothetical protein